MAAPITLKLSLPSQFRLVDVAHQAAESFAGLAGLGADDALNVGLAVREAVINAMKHGNALDPALPVDVLLRANGRGVIARVRDRGPGFDPAAAPDPTEPENVLRASGRGLLMIRAFVDRVEFHHRKGRGMEIVMGKRINSPGARHASRP